MKPPIRPVITTNTSVSTDLKTLYEYLEAVEHYINNTIRLSRFFLHGTYAGVVLSFLGLFTPGLSVSLASVLMSIISLYFFVRLSNKINHFLNEQADVINVLGSIYNFVEKEKEKEKSPKK